MDLAVHEQLLLLLLDDESGRIRAAHADLALAGAVLIDLLDQKAVTADNDGVHAHTQASAGVLAEAASLIANEPSNRSLRWWIDHLPGRMKPFVPRLATRLVDVGVLAEEHRRLLGLFDRTRMPERDHAPEEQIRRRMRAVLLDGQAASDDEAALAALVGSVNIGLLVSKPDRKRAKRRADELGAGDQVSDAVAAAVKAAEDAVTAAVIASTAATTVTS